MEAFFIHGIVTSAMADLYHFLKNSTQSEKLDSLLKDLELSSDLELTSELLLSITEDQLKNCKVLQIACEQVKKTILDIHTQLKLVDDELMLHSKRYFSGYRTPQTQIQIKNLKNLKGILKERTDRLIQVASLIYKVNKYDNFVSKANELLSNDKFYGC